MLEERRQEPQWWIKRGLRKDPEMMSPPERNAAQMELLGQWLRSRGLVDEFGRLKP